MSTPNPFHTWFGGSLKGSSFDKKEGVYLENPKQKFPNKKKISPAIVPLLLLPALLVFNMYCSIPEKISISANDPYPVSNNPFLSMQVKAENYVATNASAEEAAAFGLTVEQAEQNTYLSATRPGNYQLTVNLFDSIPIKTVSVDVQPATYVHPSGCAVGVKLYTEGLLVVGVSVVVDQNENEVQPAKDAGIVPGDLIRAVNGTLAESSEAFADLVNKSPESVTLTVLRDGQAQDLTLQPVQTREDGKYRLGLWVRDSTAGIGTLTFSDESGNFAALGHAITDVDTGSILTVNSGNILFCKISNATKGEKGNPGELNGTFVNTSAGTIMANTGLGIYGHITNPEYISVNEAVQVASRSEIEEGEAYILADVDGNGVKPYTVEIKKVSKSSEVNNKGLVLKVTDQNLLEKTGGIVQGMSGAPILQNDKLIGAVTHVFVNDPTRGYGIFAQYMVNMSQTTAAQ